jgi:hypothetical protein
MKHKEPWWKPEKRLQDHPEMEERHEIPSGYVIVERDQWAYARKRINLTLFSVAKRMLLGALTGFIIIAFFVFSVDDPDPDWGERWRIRPLLVTPLAGAFGILSFYLKDFVRPKGSFVNLLLALFSLLAFFVTLWLGIVLGLDGTLWD